MNRADQLEQLITEKPMTASQIATAMGISRPAALKRLRGMKKLTLGKVRQGGRGPLALTYFSPKSDTSTSTIRKDEVRLDA